LIMQLTTTGVVSGNLNLQGKDFNNETWRKVDLNFTTENSISEKTFQKLNKKLMKEYGKSLLKKLKTNENQKSSSNNLRFGLKD